MKERSVIDYLRAIGPAAIIAASIIGPGTVTTMSVLGASYRYEAIWIIVIAVILAYFYQEASIRLTIAKRKSLMQAIREQYGKHIALLVFLAGFAGALAFEAGNFIGAALGMQYLAPFISVSAWASILAIFALIACILGIYGIFENVNRALIAIMSFAFIITAIISRPSPGTIVSEGFSFKIPGGNYWLVLAAFATTIPPTVPLGISLFTLKKYSRTLNNEHPRKLIGLSLFDLRTNTIVMGLITISIIICAGTVIHPLGIQIKSAADMAIQLTPLLGPLAGALFALGLWAAGWSSGLVHIEAHPSFLSDALGIPDDPKAPRTLALKTFIALFPIAIIYLAGSSPVALIITAQALNGIVIPIVAFVLWRVTSNKEYLGEYANDTAHNVILGLLFVISTILAIRTFLSLLKII